MEGTVIIQWTQAIMVMPCMHVHTFTRKRFHTHETFCTHKSKHIIDTQADTSHHRYLTVKTRRGGIVEVGPGCGQFRSKILREEQIQVVFHLLRHGSEAAAPGNRGIRTG